MTEIAVEAQYVFKTANVVVTQIVYVMLSRFLTWTAPDRYHVSTPPLKFFTG